MTMWSLLFPQGGGCEAAQALSPTIPKKEGEKLRLMTANWIGHSCWHVLDQARDLRFQAKHFSPAAVIAVAGILLTGSFHRHRVGLPLTYGQWAALYRLGPPEAIDYVSRLA